MAGSVVVFPGQGAQSAGMGREFAASSAAAAEVFKRADQTLGFELSSICFEGPESELTRTDIQQPAIFVTSVAIWQNLLERGAAPEKLLGAAAGLSLGEYTALYAAGALSFEHALKLVRRRGQLMQEAALAAAGGMVSIAGGKEQQVQALCAEAAAGDVLVPANFNCPGQIVISGSKAACERAVELAPKHDLRAVPLKVAGAFHSPLMAPAADGLRSVLDATPVSAPQCPVIANVTAQPHGDAESIRDALCKQVTHAVRWQNSMEKLIDQGYDRFVEVGPGRVLTGLMRKINRRVRTVNIATVEALEEGSLCAATK